MIRVTIRRAQVWKDQVAEWKNVALGKHSLVVAEATREVFRMATTTQPSVKATGGTFIVGAVPIDTQELYNSQILSVNGLFVAMGPDAHEAVPDKITQRTNVSLYFDADYARFVEYGTAKMEGRFFVTSARQAWLSIVAETAARYSS